jgi:hypothetical protein
MINREAETARTFDNFGLLRDLEVEPLDMQLALNITGAYNRRELLGTEPCLTSKQHKQAAQTNKQTNNTFNEQHIRCKSFDLAFQKFEYLLVRELGVC